MSVQCNMIVAGVGGQGVLSLSAIMGLAAIHDGLTVKQSEVHGMAQRGGAVHAHLRVADGRIASALIPKGHADLIVGLEPMESLRYLDFLSPQGTVITSINPVKNIPNYTDVDELLERISTLPSSITVDCERLAREAGSIKATNVVLIGVASSIFPVGRETLLACIKSIFGKKGPKVIETNLRAFELGRQHSSGLAANADVV